MAGHFVFIIVDNDFSLGFVGEISTGMRRPEDNDLRATPDRCPECATSATTLV